MLEIWCSIGDLNTYGFGTLLLYTFFIRTIL